MEIVYFVLSLFTAIFPNGSSSSPSISTIGSVVGVGLTVGVEVGAGVGLTVTVGVGVGVGVGKSWVEIGKPPTLTLDA